MAAQSVLQRAAAPPHPDDLDGGAVAGPRVVEEYASQIDICATILGQLEVAHDDFDYSKDIFAPTPPPQLRVTTPSTTASAWSMLREKPSGRHERESDFRDTPAVDVGRTMLQTTYTDIGNR